MKEFMHYKSSTYKEADCCNSGCDLAWSSTEYKPCWGNVAVVDEINLGMVKDTNGFMPAKGIGMNI